MHVVRVVFYTHTAFLESALGLVRSLSHLVELHVLLEVSPRAWQLAAFDLPRRALPASIVPAGPLLAEAFPQTLRAWWESAASFNLVVHTSRRFYAPGSLRVSHAALRSIARTRPDVLHLDSAPLRLSLLVGTWPSQAVVLSEHDPLPHAGEGDWRTRLARWLSYRRVDRFIVHHAAGRAVMERAYRIRGDRVAVVRLGASDVIGAWRETPSEPDERMILFFGRLAPYKGLDQLYAAARQVSESLPGLRIVVAGRPVDGYRLPPPPALANGGRIEVIPEHISNQRLVALCQRASVVVCPYVEATQSGVLLTAYGLGKPVIGTRVGGLPDYLKDGQTGVLVPPRDAQALARAIQRVLEDRAFREHLVQGVKTATETELEWGSIARQTLEVYEDARLARRRA